MQIRGKCSPTSHKTRCIPFINSKILILLMDTFAIYFGTHTKHKNALYGKMQSFNFKACVNDGSLKSNSPRLKEDSSQLNREFN
jgi:hypothetical protein